MHRVLFQLSRSMSICKKGLCIFVRRHCPTTQSSTAYVLVSSCWLCSKTWCILQPEDVAQEVATSYISASDASRLETLWKRFMEVDISAEIKKDEKLIQLHGSAEQLDVNAERLFHLMSVRDFHA